MDCTFHMGWVVGWAIPIPWFEAKVIACFPQAKHTFFSSSVDLVEQIEQFAPYDHLIGYSLGSLLILVNKDILQKSASCFTLISPILGFTEEMGLGGVTPKIKLQYLKKTLKLNPLKACTDFYTHTGMDILSAYASRLDVEQLRWGIDQLEKQAYTLCVPTPWNCFCGKQDPLLNSDQLKEKIPQLIVVNKATHEPMRLLEAFAEGLT